jgi:hypothetical protein
MPTKGRPPRGYETNAILLRVPTPLVERIDAYRAALEAQIAMPVTRQALLVRLLNQAMDAVDQGEAPRPHEPPSRVHPIDSPSEFPRAVAPVEVVRPPEPSNVIELRPATPLEEHTSSGENHQAAPTRSMHGGGRERVSQQTLETIADEYTLCQGLSLREFARRLYERGIYRARGDKPAEAGWLKRQLDKAREAGLL